VSGVSGPALFEGEELGGHGVYRARNHRHTLDGVGRYTPLMTEPRGEKPASRLNELRAKYGRSPSPERQSSHLPDSAQHLGAIDDDGPRNTFFFYRGTRSDGSTVRFPRMLRLVSVLSAVLLLMGVILLSLVPVVGALFLIGGVAIPALAFGALLLWITFGFLDTPYDKQTKLERRINEPVNWAK
jgi:hypothetical protein